MNKRIDIKERIIQRTIGFNFRQIEFFNEYPEFKPDKFCRKAIDEQIEEIDYTFLTKQKKEELNKNDKKTVR